MGVYALLYSDPHISPSNEFAQPSSSGLTTLLDQSAEGLEWVAENVARFEPRWVICPGDWTHVPGILDAPSLYVLWNGHSIIKRRADDYGGVVVDVVGNHDSLVVEGDLHLVHSLHFFGDSVVARPRLIELKDKVLGRHGKILCIPYTTAYEHVETLIRNVAGRVDFVVTHVDVLGASWGLGGPAKLGVRPMVAEESRVLVFNGHHHEPQDMNPYWRNVGSLGYRSFHDTLVTMPRGILLLYDDGAIKRLENPYTERFHTVRGNTALDQVKQLAARPDAKQLNLRALVQPDEVESAEALGSDFLRFRAIPVYERKTKPRIAGVVEATDPVGIFRAYAKEVGLDEETVEFCLGFIAQAVPKVGYCPSIDLLDIEATDFMSYEHLSLKLDGRGIRLIDGRKGAGKSAIGEAIYFALYGKTVRKAPLDKVVRRGADAAVVTLRFMREDHEYKVVRRAGKGGHKLEVFINGEREGADDQPKDMLKAEAQKLINQAFGLDETEILQVCYLDLDRSFLELSDAGKKEVLESLGESPVFALAHELVQKVWTNERPSEDVIRCDRLNAESKAKLVQHQAFMASQGNDLESARAVLTQRLEKAGGSLLAAQEEYDLSSVEQPELDAAVLEVPGGDLSSPKILGTKQKLADARKELAVLSAKMVEVKADRKKLAALSMGRCPTCGQPAAIHEEQVEWLRVAEGLAAELASKKATLDQSIPILEDRLARLQQSAATFQSARLAAESAAASGRLRSQTARTVVEEAKRQIAAANADITRLDGNFAWMKATEKLLAEAVEKTEADLAAARKRFILVQNGLLHLGPPGIRSQILDRILDPLNLCVDGVAKGFEDHLKVVLHAEKAGKDGKAQQRIHLEVEPSSYLESSKGERRVVDHIVLPLGFQQFREQRRGAPNFMIVDECDAGLDAVAVESFLTLLSGLDKRILYVTHNHHSKAFVSDTIYVTKKDGVSLIEERNRGA